MIRKNAVFALVATPPGQQERKEADCIRRKALAFLRASFHEEKGLLMV